MPCYAGLLMSSHVHKWLTLTMLLVHGQGGSKHGLGIYMWPNMASYKGEWQNGCMHGVGTFKSPDGTAYEVCKQPPNAYQNPDQPFVHSTVCAGCMCPSG